MAWGKAGSTTLSSAGDDIDITSLSESKTRMIMSHVLNSGACQNKVTFNDTGSSKYACRIQYNDDAEDLRVNQNFIPHWDGNDNASNDQFVVSYLCDVEGEEKLGMYWSIDRGTAGAGNTIRTREMAYKFIDTPKITRFDLNNQGSGDYGADSNVTILGSEITPAAAVPAVPSLMKSLQSPSVGGWKEVGRVSLSGTSSSVDLSSSNKRYYMVLCTGITTSTNGDYQLEYNGDASGGDYNNRTSFNGGSDYQENGVNYLRPLGTTNGMPFFDVNYVANKSDKEKLVLGQAVQSNGTGTGTGTVTRSIYVGKYTNTSAAINEIKAKLRVGTFDSGELVVLGYDPDDTHTDNFWEELASVTLTADSRIIDSGTFTAKKFLKFAIYNTAKASGNNYYMYFNNIESGTTHSGRSNTNGRNPTSTSTKSDYELTGSNGFIINHDPSASGSTTQLYSTGYIANTLGEQKLSINYAVTGWTNATDASQAPARFQTVDKATTTDQITSIQFGQSSGTTVGAGSIIKVWGHD